MSRPTPHVVPRPFCYRCFKAGSVCICATVPTVANRIGVTILQHPRERRHPLGTVRILRLGLADVRVVVCAPGANAGVPLPNGGMLLYPGPATAEPPQTPPPRPAHLVVLDGTWSQVRKLYAADPRLGNLPRLSLRPSHPSAYRVRREPRPNYLSTVEAVVMALRTLEPATVGLDGLLDSFDAMVTSQLRHRAGRTAAFGAYIRQQGRTSDPDTTGNISSIS